MHMPWFPTTGPLTVARWFSEEAAPIRPTYGFFPCLVRRFLWPTSKLIFARYTHNSHTTGAGLRMRQMKPDAMKFTFRASRHRGTSGKFQQTGELSHVGTPTAMNFTIWVTTSY